MHALIFEPDAGGHRLTYVRQLLPALEGLCEVSVVLGQDALDTDAFRVQLAPLGDRFQFHGVPFERAKGTLNKGRAANHALEHAIDAHHADHVFLPSADGLAQILGLPGSRTAAHFRRKRVSVEACMHRGPYAYPASGVRDRVYRRLRLAALTHAPLARVQYVDVVAYEWLAAHGHPLARRASVLPDPVDDVPDMDKRDARSRLSLPEDGRLISLSGAISTRKGADLLLKAFASAKLASNDRLLLAGRTDTIVRTLLDGALAPLVREGRVIVMDRYISDDELAWSMSAADVVCTCHPNHVGLSNICLRAMAANRPVLTGDYGWFRAVVPHFGLGWTCNVSDEQAFARGLTESLERAPSWAPTDATRRLRVFHDPANTRACFAANLCQRLGRDTSAVKTWEWAKHG
ncbi:MAG: glycosyltransferase [Phycisphaerales bacterium]|jgi:glycosyltransferase involved in cell wall biosynthesis|nr:glycosyltransferase [Phycisphaerales bacterium]